MRRILFTLLFLLSAGLVVQAQQDARYTKFMFNKLVFNPAYAGSGDGLSLAALYRYQWVNIDGAPTGGTISAHAPLGINKKFGVGGWLEYDKIGIHNRISTMLNYSYSFILGETKLALGLQGGIQYISTDITQLEGNEAIDPTIDPAFSTDIESKIFPNFGLGIYYYKPNSFYVGASVPHLLDNSYDTPSKLGRQYRHYHFMAGGVIPAGKSFKIKPSALVKVVPVNAPVQLDANLMFLIKDIIWLGTTYRTAIGNTNGTFESESIDAIVAFQLMKGLRIGYAYDYTLSDLNKYTSGSHEVMVGYDMKGKGPRIRTPRYF